MIINTSEDLCKVLKFLEPEAKCSVWDTTDLLQYYGETAPQLRFNMFVDWRSDKPCPSEDDIKQVDLNVVDSYYEEVRKQQRNEYAKESMSLVSNYLEDKKSNPEISFSEFLDAVEDTQKSL